MCCERYGTCSGGTPAASSVLHGFAAVGIAWHDTVVGVAWHGVVLHGFAAAGVAWHGVALHGFAATGVAWCDTVAGVA